MAKKIFAFIMAAVLAFTAFAGCTAQKDADTHFVIDQETAPIVLKIFELYASGQS